MSFANSSSNLSILSILSISSDTAVRAPAEKFLWGRPWVQADNSLGCFVVGGELLRYRPRWQAQSPLGRSGHSKAHVPSRLQNTTFIRPFRKEKRCTASTRRI